MYTRGKLYNLEYANLTRRYNWEVVQKCFVRDSITPTDIDMVIMLPSASVEQEHGHFLWFECKSEDMKLSEGQRIFYKQLLNQLYPFGTLFIIEHPTINNNIIDLSLMKRLTIVKHNNKKELKQHFVNPCDLTILKMWCQEWSLHTQGKPNKFDKLFVK